MPRLIWPWVIDINLYRITRDLGAASLSAEVVDALLRRAMLHVHPQWDEQQYQEWLQEEEDAG
jgi:hypothetical protein